MINRKRRLFLFGGGKPRIDLDIATDGTGYFVSILADIEAAIAGTVSVTPTSVTAKEISLAFSGLSGDEIINVKWPTGTDNVIALYEPSTTTIDSGSATIPDLLVTIGTIASTSLDVKIEVVQ